VAVRRWRGIDGGNGTRVREEMFGDREGRRRRKRKVFGRFEV